MRKLNVRFLIWLLVATAILVGGLWGVHYLQHDRIAAALLWQAETARQENRLDQAAQHYERYLEFRPNDSRAVLAFADMLEEEMNRQPLATRQPRKIVFLLERVLELEPDRDDVRRRVVNHYLLPRLRRYKDAEAHLDILQRKSPEDGSLWQQRAICQEQTGQYLAAAESLEQAIRFPPDQVRSHELLARLLRRRLNRAQRADEVIAQMVRNHPDSPEAYLARARYRMEFNLGDFADDARQAISLAPENPEAILLYARSLQLAGKVEEAKRQLEEGIRRHPQDARMYRHLAWIEYFAKRLDSARQWLQAGIIACPEAHELQTALAELLIQGKMFDQVQKIVDDLKSRGVREERIKYLIARIAVEQGHWTDAVQQLERLRAESRTDPELAIQVHIVLAQCFKQLGDSERQADSLRRVLEMDAQSLPARLGLAALHANAGRLNEAIKEYEQILHLPSVPDHVPLELARLMIRRKIRNRADATPWADIEKLIAQAEQRRPNAVDAWLVRSEFLLARQRANDALALLAANVPASKEPRAWIQYAHCAEIVDRSGPDILDQAQRVLGDLPELRLKRAAILLQRSPLTARGIVAALEKAPAEWTADQRHQLWQGLAELYLVMQDDASARRLLRQLAQERPHDLHCRVLLAESAIQDGQLDLLPALLSEIRRLEPPGGSITALLEVRHALALAEQGDVSALERARPLLQSLAQQRPNSFMVHQACGRLAECEGDTAKAISHYRQALELGDTDLQTPHRLVRLLVESKKSAEAEAVLSRVQQRAVLPVEKQRSMLTQIAPLLRSSVVQQFVQQAWSDDTPDPRELVWQGKMLWDTGDKAAAYQSFRSAVDKGRHLPETWITLAEALFADGKTDEARQLIDQARRSLPADLAHRVVAACHEALQEHDRAVQEYRQMMEAGILDPMSLRRYVRLLILTGRTADAIASLQRLLAEPNSLEAADRAWVRRNLAVLGIAERTPEQFERGFELLRQNEAENGRSVDDLRAKVVLWSQQPNHGQTPTPRQQAIRLLEEMVRRGEASREDRFVLARLHDVEGNWDKAEPHYRAAAATDRRNPMPLAHLARRMLQKGKLQEAEAVVQQVEALAPNSVLAVNLRCRLLFQQNRIGPLLQHLATFISGKEKADDTLQQCFLAATLLDEFVRRGRSLSAEDRMRLREMALQYYERSIRARPEAVVRIVGLWSHTGEREAALRWLRDPRMKIPVNLRASAEITALREAHADEAQCQLVEQWLRATARQHPEVSLDLHLAELAEFRHDFATAAQLYRQVLAQQPNHVVALNNLAWVLAHQGPSAEALQLVQRAIVGVGPIPDLLDTRARVYLALGRAIEAIQDLEDAIAEAPTALRYFHLAMAHDRAGNAGAAQDAMRWALELGFDERDLHPVDLPDLERLKRRD